MATDASSPRSSGLRAVGDRPRLLSPIAPASAACCPASSSIAWARTLHPDVHDFGGSRLACPGRGRSGRQPTESRRRVIVMNTWAWPLDDDRRGRGARFTAARSAVLIATPSLINCHAVRLLATTPAQQLTGDRVTHLNSEIATRQDHVLHALAPTMTEDRAQFIQWPLLPLRDALRLHAVLLRRSDEGDIAFQDALHRDARVLVHSLASRCRSRDYQSLLDRIDACGACRC